MNRIDTLECPSCGGKLLVGIMAKNSSCAYCANKYLIQREPNGIILKPFMRCPVCNRNDTTINVSVYVRSQLHNNKSTISRTHANMRKIGNEIEPANNKIVLHSQPTQISELVNKLMPPAKPQLTSDINKRKGTSKKVLVSTILCGLLGILSASFYGYIITIIFEEFPNKQATLVYIRVVIYALISFIPLLSSILLFILALPRERVRNKEILDRAGNYHRELLTQFEDQTIRWNTAMEKWNKLYYCGRDDCVFLPDANTVAQIDNMVEYIYQ